MSKAIELCDEIIKGGEFEYGFDAPKLARMLKLAMEALALHVCTDKTCTHLDELDRIAEEK